MIPSTAQIVGSIAASLRSQVLPNTTDPFARSILLTSENLLNHLALRVELEGDALFEDNADLGATLRQAIDDIASSPELSAALAPEIEIAQRAISVRLEGYPSVAKLTRQALELRAALDGLIGAFQLRCAAFADQPGYRSARTGMRAYLGRQVGRWAPMITPAFVVERR